MGDHPDEHLCECGRTFRGPGKRCWYCQREWEDRKADYDADRFEERARARIATKRTETNDATHHQA